MADKRDTTRTPRSTRASHAREAAASGTRATAAGAASQTEPRRSAENALRTRRTPAEDAPARKLGQPAAAPALPSGDESASAQAAKERVRSRRGKRTRKPNFITRTVTNWLNRVLGAVAEGSLSDQEELYASHRTTRDYIWNSVGTGVWGMVFPVLTIVATQLVGTEQAGMFSMAFITGLLLMFVGNYGVRTYQISDLEEEHSFNDYLANRILTCVIMMLAGWAYCSLRGYGDYMFLICVGVYLYKMIDALADVYEGRLQQMDKLYLAGISQAIRSAAVLVVFSVLLFVTRNLAVASIGMAVAAVASFVILTLPLALLETPRSKRLAPRSVIELFKQCFPLFLALFMYNLIDNMPKFVMEGVLAYDNQLYFNALYFPAHALLLTVQLIYKPQLVRLANTWADRTKRTRFDIVIIGMLVLIAALTAGLAFIMSTVGIPILSFLYGVDFEPYRGLAYIMVAAGGVTAAIDFLCQIVTVLRKQSAITKVYLITFLFSLFVPVLLVNFTGLPGAVIGYLIVMTILFVLLIWEYMKIRMGISKDEGAEADAARRASEKASRERRAAQRALPEYLREMQDPEDPAVRAERARERLRARKEARSSSGDAGSHAKK